MTNTTTTLTGDSCPYCGDYMSFTKAGKLQRHGRRDTGMNRNGCRGSGLTPAEIHAVRLAVAYPAPCE